MKKQNIILIGILTFSIFPLFFIQSAVAAYGDVWIYPDGDVSGRWAMEPFVGDHYEKVEEQSETKYLYMPGQAGAKQIFTMDDVSLTNKYIPNVRLYVMVKNVGGSRLLSLSMVIASTTYTSENITVSGESWYWEIFSASKSGGGCWSDADIDAMQASIEAFDEETDDVIRVSRMKVKVYWNSICL